MIIFLFMEKLKNRKGGVFSVQHVRQAVIMVGGMGTRLRPLTNNCPKPILPILDKPCVEYFIDFLANIGIKEVIMACGFKSQQVRDSLGDGSKQKIKVSYSYENFPMGTGGAIKLIEDSLDDVFIAINGDNFMDIDLEEMVSQHFKFNADVTVSLSTTDSPCEVGIVRLADDGKILEFKEKPRPEEVFSNIFNTGIYVVSKHVLRYVPEGTMYDFSKELIPSLMQRGCRIQGYKNLGYWIDIGRPKDFLEVNLLMANRHHNGYNWSSQFKNSNVIGGVYLGTDGFVKDSEIVDSVISKNCSVTRSRLKRSLILPGCTVDGCIVENAIVGKNCKIENSKLKGCVIADSTEFRSVVLEDSRI